MKTATHLAFALLTACALTAHASGPATAPTHTRPATTGDGAQSMSHLALTPSLNGKNVDGLEKVSETEYLD